MNDDDRAIEELKMLQEIIGRQEGHAMRVKALFFAFILGVTAVIYPKGLDEVRFAMFCGAVVLTVIFMVWECQHRALSQQAIIRAGEVEQQLRFHLAYDGPRIGLALSRKIRYKHVIEEAFRPWILFSYIAALASLGFVFFFAPSSKDDKPEEPIRDISETQGLPAVLACPTFLEIQKFSPVR